MTLAVLALFTLLVPSAEAGMSRKEKKELEKQIASELTGVRWATKDLPVKSGQASYASYISPLTEITPEGFTIDNQFKVNSHVMGAETVWYGVRAYDTVELDDVDVDDEFIVLTFDGVGGSERRDTKVKLIGDYTSCKPILEELLTTADPVDPSWPQDIQDAIRARKVVNGMNKRQAYLVVGEPANAQVLEQGGKKVELWSPRSTDGVRMGFGATVKTTGYPPSLRFEDGVLVGVTTNASGGVNLDD